MSHAPWVREIVCCLIENLAETFVFLSGFTHFASSLWVWLKIVGKHTRIICEKNLSFKTCDATFNCLSNDSI